MINKKGQTVFMGAILGFVIFMMGILFLTFIQNTVDDSQEASALDCDNSEISDGTKVTCLLTELVSPYFIIALVSVAGGAAIARFIS